MSVGYRSVIAEFLSGIMSINLWLHLQFTDPLGFVSECGCTLVINHCHVIIQTCSSGKEDGTLGTPFRG